MGNLFLRFFQWPPPTLDPPKAHASRDSGLGGDLWVAGGLRVSPEFPFTSGILGRSFHSYRPGNKDCIHHVEHCKAYVGQGHQFNGESTYTSHPKRNHPARNRQPHDQGVWKPLLSLHMALLNWLVVSTHLKILLVTKGIFPNFQDENKQKYELPPPSIVIEVSRGP